MRFQVTGTETRTRLERAMGSPLDTESEAFGLPMLPVPRRS